MKRHLIQKLPRLLNFACILAMAHGTTAQLSIHDADESQVRAMMLVNLTKFINWPPERTDNHSPFVLCVMNNDTLSADLEAILSNKTIQGNAVQLKRLNSIDQAETCHLLYVARLKRGIAVDPAGTLANASVLTVSSDHVSGSGSIIGLPIVDGRIQIEVDRGLARRAHLTLSSHLLQIAVNSR